MKKYLILLALLTAGYQLSAQKRTIELNRSYATAKIVQIGKGVIPAKNMILVNDTLLRYDLKSPDGSFKMKQLSTAEIRYVKIRKGSYAGVGALAGGGMGFLSSVYGVLVVKNDPTLDDSDVNWTPFILGFTAGGALIGTITGLCIPKWRTYFIPNNSTSFSIKITPAVSPYYTGIGMKVRF